MEFKSKSCSENETQLQILPNKLNSSKINSKSFLNTRGCCFFCFKIIKAKIKVEPEVFRESNSEEGINFISSLQSICCHLNIDLSKDKKNVELCESCRATSKRFTKLLEHFEKVQMEMDYYLKLINEGISEAYKNPELIQVYSQRMTSNRDTLAQLADIDKLRKDIRFKISKILNDKRQLFIPIVKITEEEVEKILSAGRQTHQQTRWDDEMDDDPDPVSPASASPPSSPSPPPSHSILAQQQFESPKQSFPTLILGQHYSKNLKSGRFDCKSCSKTFRYAHGVRSHYKTIHFGKTYDCRICKKRLKRKIDLQRHKKRFGHFFSEEKNEVDESSSVSKPGTKSTFNSETGRYNCTGCTKDFKSHMGCWFHYNSIHLQKKYKCGICKIAEFSHPHSLKDHQLICEDTLKQRLAKEKAKLNDSREKLHQCKICGKKFFKLYRLADHRKRVHLKERNHPCDICLKRFNNPSQLREHKNSVHLKNTFFCKICHKNFRWGKKSKEMAHKQLCLKKQQLRKQKRKGFKLENNLEVGPSSSVKDLSSFAVIETEANMKVEAS